MLGVLYSRGALFADASLVIWYPAGHERGLITFDKLVVTFAQYLGVAPIAGRGVDRLDIFPKKKSCRGFPGLPTSEKSGADLSGFPVPISLGMVSFSQLLPDRSTKPSEFSALA